MGAASVGNWATPRWEIGRKWCVLLPFDRDLVAKYTVLGEQGKGVLGEYSIRVFGRISLVLGVLGE